MLDLPISQVPLVFVDTETTGLSPRFGDRMVEIALVRFRGDVMENFYTTLLNPERSISPGAARIHGITDRDVRDAPRFREVAPQVRDEMENAVLVAARDLEPTEVARVQASELRRADAETLEDALDDLATRVDVVYVHIDLDVLDPSVARANVLSVEGGLDVAQLEQALSAIQARFEVAAAALTAYDPSRDREGRIPEIAVTLARRLTPEKVAS